jgi:hypothetical protein
VKRNLIAHESKQKPKTNMKSETRTPINREQMPKSEGSPKPEGRMKTIWSRIPELTKSVCVRGADTKQSLIGRLTFYVSRALPAMTLGLGLWTLDCPAQSGNTNSAPQQFYTTAFDYFTSFDTNLLTFQTNYHGCAWAGADYQSGVNVASSLGLEYGLYKSVSVESVTRNAAIAGTILSEEVALGLNYTVYDTQLTGGAGIGDNFAGVGSTKSGLYGVIFAEAKKALSENTFAGTRIEAEIQGASKAGMIPVFTVFVGFKF